MPRLAVLADIHGNAAALEAVLRDVSEQQADGLVNLGDIVSGPLDPRATLDLLSAHRVVTVRGNHERALVAEPQEQLGASDRYAAQRLTDRDEQWLRQLPRVAEPAPGVLAFHGSPTDDLCYLLQTSTPQGLREATDDEITDRLGEHAGRFRLYLCGHTHLQRVRPLPGGSLVVNPGSVGMPAFSSEVPYPHVAEAGTPEARYALVDDRSGRWRAEPRRVTYDHESAARAAEANGRPEIAHALRTGRAG